MAFVENNDGTFTHSHAQGSQTYARQPGGTFYRVETPTDLVRALESAAARKSKVRVFYGDPQTGRDWLEEHDTEGRLGRSMGPLKVPLLISPRESGGPALLDHCIVRLMENGREVWRHPSYTLGNLETAPGTHPERPVAVLRDGEAVAGFRGHEGAARWIAFMRGEGPKPGRERRAAPEAALTI